MFIGNFTNISIIQNSLYFCRTWLTIYIPGFGKVIHNRIAPAAYEENIFINLNLIEPLKPGVEPHAGLLFF